MSLCWPSDRRLTWSALSWNRRARGVGAGSEIPDPVKDPGREEALGAAGGAGVGAGSDAKLSPVFWASKWISVVESVPFLRIE